MPIFEPYFFSGRQIPRICDETQQEAVAGYVSVILKTHMDVVHARRVR